MGKQYLNGVLYGTGEIIKFSPYIYSLKEREVGVWTDGKPLYQKSFTTICLSVKTIIELDDEIRVKNSAAFVTDSNGINYIPNGNVDGSDYVRISVNEKGTFPSYEKVQAYYLSKFSWSPNQDYYNYLKEYSMENPTYKIFLTAGTGANYITTIIANDIQSIGSNSCTCYSPYRTIWMNGSTATASDTAASGNTFIPSYQTNRYIYFDDLNDFLSEFGISQNNCVVLENSYYLTHQNAYVTIQYTKTTDLPGSGHYTTTGEKTHHYSTTEQVIGTWVDGSTIYEKSFEITLPSSYDAPGGFLVENDATYINAIISFNGTVKATNELIVGSGIGASGWKFAIHRNPDSQLLLYTVNDGANMYGGTAYITIQYTKVTT